MVVVMVVAVMVTIAVLVLLFGWHGWFGGDLSGSGGGASGCNCVISRNFPQKKGLD